MTALTQAQIARAIRAAESAVTDDAIQRNGPRRPMHRLTPAEHAAMGWAHGQYKGGYCFSLMCEQNAEGVAEFKAEAAERGAEYVALLDLPEYRR